MNTYSVSCILITQQVCCVSIFLNFIPKQQILMIDFLFIWFFTWKEAADIPNLKSPLIIPFRNVKALLDKLMSHEIVVSILWINHLSQTVACDWLTHLTHSKELLVLLKNVKNSLIIWKWNSYKISDFFFVFLLC